MSKSNKLTREQLLDKVKGAMYGFAIGDAMGATTEFVDKVNIRKVYGQVNNIIGGGWLNLKPGQVTDDTEMMLCVAEGYRASIASGTKFQTEVAKRFIHWLRSGPRDVGNQCFAAINLLAANKVVPTCDNALGNGALMRALPMALVGDWYCQMVQADLTHNNMLQHQAINEYHELVGLAIQGKCGRVQYQPEAPSGHVMNTLHNAVWAATRFQTIKDTIVWCVNEGGDADTIAAIAGGLAGAKHGWQNIPKDWINQLDSGVKSQLDENSDFLVACCLSRWNNV